MSTDGEPLSKTTTQCQVITMSTTEEAGIMTRYCLTTSTKFSWDMIWIVQEHCKETSSFMPIGIYALTWGWLPQRAINKFGLLQCSVTPTEMEESIETKCLCFLKECKESMLELWFYNLIIVGDLLSDWLNNKILHRVSN